MPLKENEEIIWRLLDNKRHFRAKVIKEEGNEIVAFADKTEHINVSEGQHAIITKGNEDIYTEIRHVDGPNIHFMKHQGADRRSYFRVEDALPVITNAVKDYTPYSARIMAFNDMPLATSIPDDIHSDDSMFRILSDINNKLDFLINAVILQQEGLTFASPHPVNLSASGIKIRMNKKVSAGEILEIRIVLPLNPPVAIVVYGEVIRAIESTENNETYYNVALKFKEMPEDVKEKIIQYTLKRQREVISHIRDPE